MDTNRVVKHRLFLIDILRVLCSLLIYMRHSITMYCCTYGSHVFDGWIVDLTSPVMTCFFILSGFSIHYQHMEEEVTSDWTREYLKKRLISIMPSYLLVVVIWPFAYPAQLEDWVLLLPVDLVGVQTTYHTLFGILHNGGTWFVSCILMGYILYPVIKSVISTDKKWGSASILIATHFLMMYSYIIIPKFNLYSLYSNPIARSAEFTIGVSFAEIIFGGKVTESVVSDDGQIRSKTAWGGKAVNIIIVLTVISVVLATANHESKRMLLIEYLVIPIVGSILLAASYIRCGILERSRILGALSGMSYQFYLVQHFLWYLSSWFLGLIKKSGNIAQLSVSFCLGFSVSLVVWKFYDKPIRKMLKKRFLYSGDRHANEKKQADTSC